MPELSDRRARAAIHDDLDHTLVVEAAAGTGKTSELIGRMIAVLVSGRARVDSLVAVTFTEKAAGELKLRLREGLEAARRRHEGDARRNLEDALARLEEARVGTIHAFCTELLRERSVEAGVDPEFETMNDPEAKRCHRRVFDLWFQETLADPPEGVRRSLRRSSFRSGEEGPISRLWSAAWVLTSWRDFTKPWRREPFERVAEIEALVARARDVATQSAACDQPRKDVLFDYAEPVRAFAARVDLEESAREGARARRPDWDALEAALVDLRYALRFGPKASRLRTYGGGLTHTEMRAHVEDLRAALGAFTEAADADLAALLFRELRGMIEAYQEAKQKLGRMDFVDLLHRARDLVAGDADVRAAFQARFSHLFVDEFQDTDPLQAEILLLLAADDPAEIDWRKARVVPGKLFLVGDPRQAIYRFRRADVGTYLEVKGLLESRGARVVELTTSFRSVPGIQRAVNHAFEPLMSEDPVAFQAEYVPLTEYRAAHEGQPAVVALPVPRPHGAYGRVAKGAVAASLPGAVAAFVDWLLGESNWQVTERERPDAAVPIAARHVCLLFRRFQGTWTGDVTGGYVRALDARGIRHLLVGGRSYHEKEEVETIRTALTAVEWPDDELSVFATLRGPLFAIDDESLFTYRVLPPDDATGRVRVRRLSPFRVPRDLPDALAPIAEALTLLRELHVRRNERPIAETVRVLLDRTRAHAGFVLRPSGEQVLANVVHVAEEARRYEREGGISFRGFVDRLIEDAKDGAVGEAPILEDGSDGVRIMTVHKAKGLEFPVIILCDIGARLAMPRAGQYVDASERLAATRIGGWLPREVIENEPTELERDAAEGVRLAYVAATRARDVLVVPALGEGSHGFFGAQSGLGDASWVAPLAGGLYPDTKRWKEAKQAPGTPVFGRTSVISNEPVAFEPPSVRPGLHAMPGYGVVWWDPHLLDQADAEPTGVAGIDLIEKDVDASVVERDLARHGDWRDAHHALVEHASSPSLLVETATARAFSSDATAGPDDVEIAVLPGDATKRPHGKRFGALVHALLATVPLGATPERIGGAGELEARILGATDEERAAAVALVGDVLAHPLLVEAAGAADIRRETPVTCRLEDGSILEGVVDLAYKSNDAWVVVDFKTDVEMGEALDPYRRQVSFYTNAVAEATGEPARAVLFRI